MRILTAKFVIWETGAGLTSISFLKFKPDSTGLLKLLWELTTMLPQTSGALPA